MKLGLSWRLFAAFCFILFLYLIVSITQWRSVVKTSAYSLLDTNNLQIGALGFANITNIEDKQKTLEVLAAYNKARAESFSKVDADTHAFKAWTRGVNICSVAAIIVTFFIGLCGALAGIPLSAPPSQQDWERLSATSRRVRAWILTLSAISGMVVTIGNRMSASASQYQQATNQTLSLIDKCDADFSHALNLDERLDVVHKLETGIRRL